MRRGDLDEAMRLRAEAERAGALHARIDGGEALTVVLGDGASAVSLHLSASYLDHIRRDLAAAFARAAVAAEDRLAELGVAE